MRNRDGILIFIVGVVAFTVGLSPEFVGYQTRFALFAQQMLRNGPSVFPTTYLGPYPDYPSLTTIMILPFAWLAGRVSTLAGILPTAIISALVLVFTYRIGAIRSRTWGLAAVVLALFTQFFVSLSRRITPDQCTTLVTVVCFYVAYSASVSGKRRRLWWIPALLVFGFACRGPIGLVAPTGVLCVFFLCARDFKRLVLFGLVALALLVACRWGLTEAARLEGGDRFVQEVELYQDVGRMDRAFTRLHFYWLDSLAAYAVSFPLAAAVILLSLKRVLRPRDDDDRLLGYLAAWIVVVIVGMSIPGPKQTRYVLPMIPAVALAAGYLLAVPQAGALAWVRRVFVRIALALPIVLGAIAIGALVAYTCARIPWQAPYLATAIVMIAVTVAALVLNRRLRGSPAHDIVIAGAGALALVAANIGIVEPINYHLERTRPFVRAVEDLRAEEPGPVVFFRIGPDKEDVKFMVNAGEPIAPEFIDSTDAFAQHGGAWFIARERDFDALPADVAARCDVRRRGRIGHRKCVVFTMRRE